MEKKYRIDEKLLTTRPKEYGEQCDPTIKHALKNDLDILCVYTGPAGISEKMVWITDYNPHLDLYYDDNGDDYNREDLTPATKRYKVVDPVLFMQVLEKADFTQDECGAWWSESMRTRLPPDIFTICGQCLNEEGRVMTKSKYILSWEVTFTELPALLVEEIR